MCRFAVGYAVGMAAVSIAMIVAYLVVGALVIEINKTEVRLANHYSTANAYKLHARAWRLDLVSFVFRVSKAV